MKENVKILIDKILPILHHQNMEDCRETLKHCCKLFNILDDVDNARYQWKDLCKIDGEKPKNGNRYLVIVDHDNIVEAVWHGDAYWLFRDSINNNKEPTHFSSFPPIPRY